MIPLATTSITVRRPPVEHGYDASYDASDTTPQTIATDVRAHFSTPAGTEQIIGGEQSVVTLKLACDPCDITNYDLITDQTTGEEFSVVWTKKKYGLGLDHVESAVRIVTGAA